VPTAVGVRLRFAPKVMFFDPCDASPVEGDRVVVTTDRGTELGEVVAAPFEVEKPPAGLRPVVRVATEEDLTVAADLLEKERAAMRRYRELIGKHGLDMKPIGVEYLFDGSKAVFYFVAEERVDFRDLVRDLASESKARIDMRQVGVRDEARMVGGLGHCGEQLCCVRFGGEFQPVSIRMAKEQDLPLNPLKISGLCGRLMCCLRYEYEAYKDFKSRAPKRGTPVETPAGNGKVSDLNTPHEMVTVRLEEGGELKVPLEAMECPGHGCPCRVDAEKLHDSENESMVAFVASLAEREAAPPRPAAAAERGRGGRRSSGRERSAEAPPERAKEAPAPETPAAEVSEQAGQGTGRRRRRRRRGGGGASTEKNGSTPT